MLSSFGRRPVPEAVGILFYFKNSLKYSGAPIFEMANGSERICDWPSDCPLPCFERPFSKTSADLHRKHVPENLPEQPRKQRTMCVMQFVSATSNGLKRMRFEVRHSNWVGVTSLFTRNETHA
jgi:hypothetical protein